MSNIRRKRARTMSGEKTESLCTHVTGTTEVNLFHLKYEWKIVNYGLIKKVTGNSLKSEIFSPSEDPNIKWFFKIFPQADDDKNKDYVSLFLEFCPNASRQEITAQFEVTMIGTQNHIIKSLKTHWHHFKKGEYDWGYSQFIKREDLLKHGKFLPNGCLTIVCNITGQLSIDNQPNRWLNNFMNSETSKNSNNQSEYQKLFVNKVLTDVALNASGKVLHAHKAFLAAHSPVFLAMFTNNMKEALTDEVNIPDVQFEILQEVLRFIYCGTVENMETCVHDLLAVSNKYAIESLKFECEKYLSQNVKIDTVIEVLSLADTYNAANLRKYAIDFFLLHKRDIVGTENFNSFSKLQPHTIEELTKELFIRK